MNDLNDHSNVLLLAKAYKELFNQELCTTCRGDIINGYYRINAHLQNPNVMKQAANKATAHKLKAGAIVIHPTTGDMYGQANLTDEIAAEILALNPNARARFDVVADPAPIDPAPEVIKAAVSEQLDSMSLAQLKELAKANKYPKNEWKGINTKKKMLEYIAGK